MCNSLKLSGVLAALTVAGVSQATVIHNYENLNEGFLGETYSADGITYRNVNDVAGNYADGVPFTSDELGRELIIEQADLFYDDFPEFGSANNAMTFGNTFVNGSNLSIGVLASVWMDFDFDANFASLDIGFYENGPWGTIEYRLEAWDNGNLVATDIYELADGGGRDNPTFTTLSVSASSFDSLHLYAWKDGAYSAPRGMIDDLTVESVPEPTTMAIAGLGAAGLVARRPRVKRSKR